MRKLYTLLLIIILASGETWQKTTQAHFDNGTYSNAQWNNTYVGITAGSSSGGYTSEIHDASSIVNWNNISWSEFESACNVLTFQEGIDSYAGTSDTYLVSSDRDGNYGGDNVLLAVNGTTIRRPLLRFDNIFTQIPSSMTIISATITLYASAAGGEILVYEMLENWTEGTDPNGGVPTGGATWDEKNYNGTNSNNWTAPGASDGSHSSTLESSFTPSPSGFYEFSILNAVRRWHNGTSSNYGVVLEPVSTNSATFSASEHATAANRPKLTITASDYSACVNMTLQTRTCNKDTCNDSSFGSTLNNSTGATLDTYGRYFQFIANFTSSSTSATPFLYNVTAYYTPQCGNGICDPNENTCTCERDCGACGGDAPGTCKQYSCVSQACTSVNKTYCCGNSICEQGEAYSSCPADCTLCNDNDACTSDEYNHTSETCAYTTISPCCGNNACEQGETYSLCSADCPLCDDGNLCTSDSYSHASNSCTYTTIVPCCGNTICEASETYLSCNTDCAANITIADILPAEAQIAVRGRNITIKASVKINDLIGKNVTVSANSLINNTVLYDDGLHGDNFADDGIYANTVALSKKVPLGSQSITIFAKKDTVQVSKSIAVTVTGEGLNINATTDSKNYQKGQTMRISGKVIDSDGEKVAKAAADIVLSFGEFRQTLQTEIKDGVLNTLYPFSFAVPDGNWTIDITVKDELDNVGYFKSYINISTPSAVALQYNVQILSPVIGFKYKRGDTLVISAKVLENNEDVRNASVSIITPAGERLMLIESASGIYSIEYPLSYTTPLGIWSVSVEAKKQAEGILKAGGATASIQIEPVKLNLTIGEIPTIYTGDKIPITATLTYPDGTSATNMELSVSDSKNRTFIMREVDFGVYKFEYETTLDDEGVLFFTLNGYDTNQNLAESAPVNLVIFKMTILEQIRRAAPYVLLGATASIIITSFGSRTILKIRLTRVRFTKKRIADSRKAIQRKYLSKGVISKSVYDRLMAEQENKEVALKEAEMKIKEAMGKRKA